MLLGNAAHCVTAHADHVVRLADMPALVNGLIHQQSGAVKLVPRSVRFEVEIARGAHSTRTR
jgi:hypothetical protein